jgi:hypothetical protein
MTESATASGEGSAPPAPSLRLLLRRVVDYAGLFPPASLKMAAAVGEYAEHRDGGDAWALGRFVLPAARLEEFQAAAATMLPREGARSWALSALLGSDLEEDVERIERFNDNHRDARQGAVLVDTVELKAHSSRDVARASELLDRRFDTYMEIPVVDDPAELVDAISQTRAKAKLRMGGVTPDAFPASTQVLRFIGRCIRSNIAFKATAGLHHPWRSEYRLTYAHDAPQGTMFGFLNVLLATAALHCSLSESEAKALLEERDPCAVRFGEKGARWRERDLPLGVLEKARDSMAAFGSCSFREPITDLRSMSLL